MARKRSKKKVQPKNGFEEVALERVFSPQAQKHILGCYCCLKTKDLKDEELFEFWDYIERYAEDALVFLKSLPGPIRFKGGAYSYTFNPKNVFEAFASDGSKIKYKYISDIDQWASWKGMFVEALIEEDLSYFAQGNITQEQHELENLGLK